MLQKRSRLADEAIKEDIEDEVAVEEEEKGEMTVVDDRDDQLTDLVKVKRKRDADEDEEEQPAKFQIHEKEIDFDNTGDNTYLGLQFGAKPREQH